MILFYSLLFDYVIRGKDKAGIFLNCLRASSKFAKQGSGGHYGKTQESKTILSREESL